MDIFSIKQRDYSTEIQQKNNKQNYTRAYKDSTNFIDMNKNSSVLITFIFAVLISVTGHAQESQEINEVLSKKIEYNKEHPEGKGFKIQLYNGNESQAYRVRSEYQIKFNEKAELLYESPEWKVRVGNYMTRLEADRALLEIKQKFSGAIVLQTEIKL